VGKLSAFFFDLLVGRTLFEKRPIGFPTVTEALFFPILRQNLCLEPSAGLGRTVSDHKCDDLPSSPAQRNPKPALIRPLPDVGRPFIKLKDIVFFGRLDLIGYGFGFASLFLSQRERVLRLTPKMRLIALFDPHSWKS